MFNLAARARPYLGAVVLTAVRSYARPRPWWRLLPSMAPIALVAGAVLVVASGGH